MDEQTRKAFHDAINETNAAYDAEDYDRYDELLRHYAGMFGKITADFEDDCTDVRMYGFDIC